MSERIKELEAKINQARNDYYNGQSKISDKAYDAMIDELSQLDPKNLAVIGIGAEPVSEWEKYTHKVPMGSLNKAQTDDEYRKWHEKYIEQKDDVLLTLKLDGISVSLIYENGVLTKGVTRGSGVMGESITTNIAKMGKVPLRLNEKVNMTVRGEILLSKDNHQKFFSDYSNPRNAASGISRNFDGLGAPKLDILVYHLDHDTLDFKTVKEQFKYLQKLGFQVPTYYLCKDVDDIIKFKNDYHNNLRDEYDYLLDGLVAHLNDLEKHNNYGARDGRPYASIALKFDSVAKEGTISDIKIQVGNSGRLTPVAFFEPKIDLMGAMVGKATLHNFGNIKDLGIGIGAKVLVCRSGDVIPFVEEVIEPPKEIFEAPFQCPECDNKVINVGEYIQCPNFYCPAQCRGRIINWVKELNILELGEALIAQLVDNSIIETVADLYSLKVSDMVTLDRMGEKSAQNVFNSIWKNAEITLDILIGGLSIPMIGSSTIRLIMDAGYDTLEKIQNMTVDQIGSIKGIGPVKAQSLYDGLLDYQNVINCLQENGLKIKNKVVGKLTGYKIAITGSTNLKRAILEQMILEAGGENKSSVGKSTTHLIAADPNSSSSKIVNAKKLGITVITEDDLLKIIK